MNYIFLDLEWNQPRGKDNMVQKPVPLCGEIIRIGAVKLSEDMEEIARYHGYVIPKYYKKMNYMVKKVTGLNTGSITYGWRFPDAYREFRQWMGNDCVILTWGPDDEKMLLSNMEVHGIKEELPKFYDLQLIFAHRILDDGRQCSLQTALEHYELPQELRAHDALNDALYAARVGVEMGFREHIATYDEMLSQIELFKSEKYIRTYMNVPSIEAAVSSKRIMLCRCPLCSKIMKRKKWLFTGKYRVITCASCAEHGDYFFNVKMTKCPDGSLAVTRKAGRLTAAKKDQYEKALDEQVAVKC